MRRSAAWIVPFAFSVALSWSTVGDRVYWQDSGFFLTAVRETSLPYAPGFVLYLVLCKAWTLALPFVDFTLAVHLFSAMCAAIGAGALGAAARDVLTTRGPLFRTLETDETSAGVAGAAAGCLAACGYTFWFAGILAKPYALLYAVLALLLWRMIRADASGKGRDFSIAAALIGLAWAAHPSATGTGLALVSFVLAHRVALGWKGIAGRALLALACAVGPAVCIPWLAAREATVRFGNPRTFGEIAAYLCGGGGSLETSGVVGWDSDRWMQMTQLFWEELLGVGTVLATIGLIVLVRRNRKLLAWLAAWTAPVVALTALLRGQAHPDHWLVVAWLPLYLACAVGLCALGRRVGRAAIPLAAVAGMAWAVWINRPLLDLRQYDLAETLGRMLMRNLEPGSVLLVSTDDGFSITTYLQSVRGERRDVRVVNSGFLEAEWYPAMLERRGLRVPQRPSGIDPEMFWITAFSNANVRAGNPVFSERPPDPDHLRPDLAAVPAGMLWKIAMKGEASIDLKYWDYPVPLEAVARVRRRARGQFMGRTRDGVVVRPEAFEVRLLQPLIRARLQLAEIRLTEDPAAALALCDSVRAVDPALDGDPLCVNLRALALYGLRRHAEAETQFTRLLELDVSVDTLTMAYCYLGDICRALKRPEEAKRHFDRALRLRGGNPQWRKIIEERAKTP